MTNSEVKYQLSIKEFEAITGVKKILVRNDKKLEVTMPPGVKDGSQVKLRGAQKITDGKDGDILISVRIAGVVKLNPKSGTTLASIFDTCLSDIGGVDNQDINVYLQKRSISISRDEFFNQALWSIWVSGISRKAAKGFMGRVEKVMANYDFKSFGSLNDNDLDRFMAKLHRQPIPQRAQKKWEALRHIAKWLSSFSSEKDFLNEVFQGKSKGAELDKSDVIRLQNKKFPFIKEANSHYIIKNLGGQAIKQERWVNAFLKWSRITINNLEKKLSALRIPLSLFDTAFWSYCEKYIGKVNLFNSHFTTKFGYLK